MKKRIICFLAIFIFCGASISPQIAYCAPVNYNAQVSEIEKAYFGYDYPDDTVPVRLNRLEQAVYGMKYNQGTQQRIKRLYNDLAAGKNYTSSSESPNIAQNSDYNQHEELPPAEKDVRYPVVDKMEKQVLKTSYPSEDIYKRLSRLEKQVFKKESTASLNERVDALRGKVLYQSDFSDDGTIVLNDEDMDTPTGSAVSLDDSKYNYYSYQNSKDRVSPAKTASYDSAQNFDIDSLENSIFGKRYTADATSKRLARLENKVFQRTFDDSDDSRVQRLLAVTTAQRTSSQYDSNKWMNRLNTGIQIGGVILMILAMIL